jgi:hypothetical protein
MTFETIINGLFAGIFLVAGGSFVYISSVVITERKRLWREGKTDYYGNPIEQSKKPEDEVE